MKPHPFFTARHLLSGSRALHHSCGRKLFFGVLSGMWAGLFLLILLAGSPAGAGADIHELSGETMGTQYHVKISASGPVSLAGIKTRIDQALKAVNNSMSMFQENSEISRFNRAFKNTPIQISTDFAAVLTQARTLYQQTDGAWDGTLKPLVDLWGFGTARPTENLPDPARITRALSQTGFDKIILSGNTLSKTGDDVTLDLGSIAKGYGVDQITRLLSGSGFDNVLVEIGGEVRATGKKKGGAPWMVGIAVPDRQSIHQRVYHALPLENRALATSGDYRNFKVVGKRAYSHIIHPSTGYPVDNGVVSASVLADNCTTADGLATALMVMGPEKGLALVNRMENTHCLIIVQNRDGTFLDHYSDAFPRPLSKGSAGP